MLYILKTFQKYNDNTCHTKAILNVATRKIEVAPGKLLDKVSEQLGLMNCRKIAEKIERGKRREEATEE